jgi:hypothetical protein
MIRSAAVVALLMFPCVPALAQMSVGSGGPGQGVGGSSYGGQGGMTPAGVPARAPQGDDDAKPPEDKPVAPPPAIPGAQPNEDAAVVPADRVAAEMSPNEALFDAISRGDLGAAKDALNRGAQLDAHNVLGQTPTDASIDLDRNDITFLLLSMRTTNGSPPPATLAAATPATTHTKPGRKGVVPASAHAPQSKTTQLSANRGAPNPSVGFIGF